MSAMLPMALFGLEVPPGDISISGRNQIRSAYRITMAAIDPSSPPVLEDSGPARATLKIMRRPLYDDEYDSDDFDADQFEHDVLLARKMADELGPLPGIDDMEDDEDDDDDDDSDSDEEVNGGPSDLSKSKQARKAAAEKAIAKLLAEDDDEDDMEVDDELPNGVNGLKRSAKALGKLPAEDDDEDDDEDEDEDSDDDDDFEGAELDEFVICTLDPEKNYQQPLDITVGEDERVYFRVTGNYPVFLTGNYVIPADEDSDEYDSDESDGLDYDLEPDSDELLEDSEEDELDELDDLEDPRITEIEEEDGEEDEEAPKLVRASDKKLEKKGLNKRPAADDDTDLSIGLDEMITKTKADDGLNGKLSKKQLKKLKKNDGSAATTATEFKSDNKAESEVSSSAKSDKKVQFAKNLEQGPTPTKDAKGGAQEKTTKATLGVKVVQGVKIDDKKIGTGPAAKLGERVGMRYIGKLEKDNKVFDSNKKGKPFSFKLGSGEVIKGWDIGIQGMSIGGERRITIPPHLGYGAKGTAGIPGNSTLVFDVKLLENKGK